MTSRRPMTRSFSGNGRTSSFSEEEVPSSNGRNTYLSNVRPENRSTLCSVMAQLTEDIQPSFETTLKSKAVSENCNVKFTCVVSGYPVPELKWYKDDMEMDRYCGLPKYEIHRNGKTHTLHIYNCTLDDAAIYQVSASNSKGIVSCSGVLEVGAMNEFKIHQRFFAKLKQKAEKKRKDLEEQTKMENKENVQRKKPLISPEHPQRKRSVPPPEDRVVAKESEAMEELGATAEPNGISSGVKEIAPLASLDRGLDDEMAQSEETLATKRIKMSNGVDAGINISRSHSIGSGGENCYDGGISLAQFLAETLQSQAAEEKENSSQAEKDKEVDKAVASDNQQQERDQEEVQSKREEQEKVLQKECEKEKRREEELAIKRVSHTVAHGKHGSEGKHHSKGHKDHDHHNIQTSISSVLHSVKDFFFGKNKKISHDHTENEGADFDHSVEPPKPEMPPSFQLQTEHNPEVSKPLTEEAVPMEMDKPRELSETTVATDHQSLSIEPDAFKYDEYVQHTALPPSHELPQESKEESTRPSVTGGGYAVEAMEVSVGMESNGAGEEMSSSRVQVLTEAEEKDSDVVAVIKAVPMIQKEPDSPQLNHHPESDESFPQNEKSVLSQNQGPADKGETPTASLSSLGECWTLPQSVISATDNHSLGETPTETFQEEEKQGGPDMEEGCSSHELCEDEKAEVKSNKQAFSGINGSEMTKLSTSSLESQIKSCEYQTPDQVLSFLSDVEAFSAKGDHVKEETKCASPIQEMNAGFPPTALPESLDKADLKMHHKPTHSRSQEITEVNDVSAMQSSSTGFTISEGRCEQNKAMNSVLVKEIERDLCDSLQTREQACLELERTEVSLQFEAEIEKRTPVNIEEPVQIKIAQNNLTEEHNNTASQDISESGWSDEHAWPSENIPAIQISTTEDITDTKSAVPDLSQSEQFLIPKIEIMEPELKESTLPLTILALDKLEPSNLQKHDATHVPDLLPTQKGMQNDYHISPTDKVEEVAQLHDKTEKPHVERREELPQMGYASIPVINVSFTDDKEGDACVNNHVSHTQQAVETPRGPLFVVPPISVTCHESDPVLSLPTHSKQTEMETSDDTQRGTKNDSDKNEAVKPESTQNRRQDLEESSVKETTSTLLFEALKPKVGDTVPLFSKTTVDIIVPEILKPKSIKDVKTENSVSVDDPQKNRFSVERLSSKPPTSPASLRKLMSKAAPDSDNEAATTEDLSGGSTPTSSLSCESSPRMKRRDSLTLIRSATPEELASGARRKIFIPKPKEDVEGTPVGVLDTQGKKETPYMSPSQARRASLLQAQKTPPIERRSPLLNRRKSTLEVPKVVGETPTEEPAGTKREEKPAEKKTDPLKAPQVIRKIRGEPFPDASGHLKLWCQFFNVLSDSTIKWYRDEEEILEVKRSGGDESQVALAIVLASSQDCGVYGCTITNEYGIDTTDFLLSIDIMSEILLKDDLEVGEEIEMTALLFTKGLADCGTWGDKYFGRIMTETVHLGEGCMHKASRVKVIYGLDPVFESGSTCIIKVQSPIAYGTKQESNLAERNLEITKHECKVQNMIREYCKIFSAETRVIENFGLSLEVIPRYLMYRPANSVPYATVEADLTGLFLNYCTMDNKGKLTVQQISETEQKCCSFQHWIHQWTHGNLLVTQLAGVETKLTNVRVVTKSKGYQGLTECGSPEVFDQFLTLHQCNYYCGLLGLRPLKTMDSLQQPAKAKGSRSPLLNRKLGSTSPQPQRKGNSPQMSRKANSSPKVTRKVQETEDNKSSVKPKPAETTDAVEKRGEEALGHIKFDITFLKNL
ncbi:alpha-protein kinase 3 [Archocentrus centrarchus]|uniref:alpha-protein kinase 3 n=1 Tax=Archocentrus centrarchus TaxID=63155 RepID=UPI0011E9C64F|nr:alpha-protein kinase 3-like [Archocentrus centrarchus]XP_030586581.1 alpha-protein kinase 3-like [Archocentrus centrarchus]